MIEILKLILPLLIILILVVYMVNMYFKNENQKRREQIILKNQNIIIPLRLQAYERFILFLERISPENLIIRINKPGYNCKQLQTELLSSIRAEYEHNLSQQIYVSHKTWELIKNARSNIIHLINSSSEKIKPDFPSINLSKAILESTMGYDKLPTADAIRNIKEELNSII